MDEKLRKLSDMGKTITCPYCGYVCRPDSLKDKRCPKCQRLLVKEIDDALER